MSVIKKTIKKIFGNRKKNSPMPERGKTTKLTAAEVAAIQRNMNMGGSGGPRRFPLTMLGGGLGGDRDRDML